MKPGPLSALAKLPVEAKLRDYATPATTAAAAVVLLTGVMMFFHLGKSAVEAMHEWIGMVFVVVAGMHVLRHRRGFANLLKQRRTHALLGAVALAALAFLVVPRGAGGNPVHRLADGAQQAPLAVVAQLLQVPPEVVVERLRAEGVRTADAARSVRQIAEAEGVDPRRLLGAVLRPE